MYALMSLMKTDTCADGMSAAAEKGGFRHVPLTARLLGYISDVTERKWHDRLWHQVDISRQARIEIPQRSVFCRIVCYRRGSRTGCGRQRT